MKSFVFTALFAVLYFCVHAQADNRIVIGKVDSVYSNILGEQRKVWVYVPSGFLGTNDSSTHFPVVYLLKKLFTRPVYRWRVFFRKENSPLGREEI